MNTEIQYERPPTGALPLSILVEMTGWPLAAIRAGFETMIASAVLGGHLEEVEIRTDGIWQEVGTAYILAAGETTDDINLWWNTYGRHAGRAAQLSPEAT